MHIKHINDEFFLEMLVDEKVIAIGFSSEKQSMMRDSIMNILTAAYEERAQALLEPFLAAKLNGDCAG